MTAYEAASRNDDFVALGSLRHPDWQMVWPQSGEVVPTHQDYVQLRTNRPEGAPRVEPLAHGGTGDCWWTEAIVHYADGSRWLAVTVLELRDGRVYRERTYFGQSFPAPGWRSVWVRQARSALE